jgi:hypothetical protein
MRGELKKTTKTETTTGTIDTRVKEIQYTTTLSAPIAHDNDCL